MEMGVYLLLVAAILVVTCRTLRHLHLNGEERRIAILVLGCLTYALVLPRFKDYSYSLLIVPAHFVITRQRLVRPPYLLLAFLAIPYVWETLPGIRGLAGFLAPYASLLLAFGLWLVMVVMLFRGAFAPGSAAETQG